MGVLNCCVETDTNQGTATFISGAELKTMLESPVTNPVCIFDCEVDQDPA
jgi:3-mercaptopyruvate sulfurtransferase SseA